MLVGLHVPHGGRDASAPTAIAAIMVRKGRMERTYVAV